APAAFPSDSDPGEFWAVVRQDADAGSDPTYRVAASQGAGSTSTLREIRRHVAGGVNVARAASSGSTALNTGVDLSGRHVLRAVFDSSMRVDVDGVAGSTASISLSTVDTRFVIGTWSGINSHVWDGAIRQVLVTEPLTSGEAADLLAYLSEDL
ncbi:MAG TPA: hypothetical protein VF122_00195, partial [Caulobacteraceae bacterium]